MEELKLIVEAIAGLGVAGKEAFMYYLIAAWLLPYSVGVFAISVVFITAKKLIETVGKNAGFANRVSRAAYGRGCNDIGIGEENEVVKFIANNWKKGDA